MQTATKTFPFTVSADGPPPVGTPPVQPVTFTTPFDTIPNFGQAYTIYSVRNGNWSNPATWNLNRAPNSGDVVIVQTDVTNDADASAKNVSIISGGTLRFADGSKLTCAVLLVCFGGYLEMVNASTVIFTDTLIDLAIDPLQYGNGLVVFGKIVTRGQIKTPFVRTAVEPLTGHTTLTLATAPAGWNVGDRIFIPDTRQLKDSERWGAFVPRWETATITTINGAVVTLSAPLLYNHPGARNKNGVLEYLPHVGNLTRSVVFKSQNAGGVRGHTFYTTKADVDIQYTQFSGLGRTTKDPVGPGNQIGRYPTHFHHVSGRNAFPSWTFKGNSVWCLTTPMVYKWPLTVHDSHFGDASDNVIYNWAHSGVVTEDGNEWHNEFKRNFVCAIMDAVNPRNGGGSGFWLKGFGSILHDNVVASCVDKFQTIVTGVGFNIWWPADSSANTKIPLLPGNDTVTPGQYQTIDMQLKPIQGFERNETYGCMAAGLTVWQLGTGGGTVRVIAQSILKDSINWNTYEEWFFAYPVVNILVDGLIDRATYTASSNKDRTFSSGDYLAADMTFRNVDAQGRWSGISNCSNNPGEFRVENSRFCCMDAAIVPYTLSTPGGPAYVKQPRKMTLDNVIFDQWPGGPPLKSIKMNYLPQPRLGTNYIQRDELFVIAYNSVPSDNFQVYYLEQAPTFIVPTTTPSSWVIGSPVAGLTNEQTWAQYGIAIAGAVAPADAVTRPGVTGLVK